MRRWWQQFWTASIRRQLILAIALIHAVLMTVFVWDLLSRQQDFLYQQRQQQAISLSHTLAANSTSWVLANDVIGLEEVVSALKHYPELRYAMVLSPQGQVMGHTDRQKVGWYVVDALSQTLLQKTPAAVVLFADAQLVDVAFPVLLDQHLLGWARIAFTQDAILQELLEIRHDGLLYTLTAILVGTLFAVLLARGVTRGLYEVLTVVEATRQGVRDQRIALIRRDEIGQLASGFNRMLDALQSEEQALLLAQKNLLTAKRKAEEANQAKSNFLAAVSHELRTPMNVIIGLGDVMLETLLDAEQQEYVRKQQNASQNLLELINQILDLSKIEEGQVTIMEAPMRLPALLHEVIELLQILAGNKGLQLHSWLDPKLPQLIWADRFRLRQVLFNVISNSIKFTETGEISIVAQEVQEEGAQLYIEVHDTGIGITNAQLDTIFEAFTQADSSISRRFGGTGLGLAISRSLMRLMGGEITVESQIGEGSTFRIILPLRRVQDSARNTEQSLPIMAPLQSSQLRILLAEDTEDNQMLIRAFLKDSPHQLSIVNQGRAAVEQVALQCFDLILMDVQMPVMDGYTATRAIRQWEEENQMQRLPIVALTANALSGEEERSRAAGCDYYLAKPIRKQQFLALLQQIPVLNRS
ncbi:ATP-binding protein [Candidatus Magnetaquicoccus inordinatus]|uniref:ATP-binding protein n=1 Tax=Candidatus Magnetaquicoccus inordinatus TaxID=2496818 RepID=UPI00102B7998|nr:ATP-binding protein [Candidatus Magnetaquicoccus inordinatus]